MPFPSENFRHNPEQKLKIHQNTTAIPLRHRLIFLSLDVLTLWNLTKNLVWHRLSDLCLGDKVQWNIKFQ